MRSSFSSNSPSQESSSHRRLSAHWRALALGCAAIGGVGVLWLPGSAQAPAIVPEGAEAEHVPVVAPLPEMTPPAGTTRAADTWSQATAPAAQPTTRAVAQQESRISIEMRDAPVIDLLMLISAQGNVEISIGSDVEPTLRIPGIRLTDVTAADAIRKAAMTAGLQWKKLDDTTYFVGKVLPTEMGGKADGASSASSGIQPIDEGWLGPGLTSNSLQNPISALPSYNGGSGNNLSSGLVPLPNKSQAQEKEIRPIKIRNVRSGLLAYWLDPKNQPLPIEEQASQQAKQLAVNPYPLRPGVDPNIMSSLNGNSSALPFTNPYAASAANPYVNPGAANPWMQPVYRGNFLFGGGGGGGGFGGNNRGGGNQSGGGGLLELGVDEQGRQLVDQIISVDAQNVLLVYGTPDGIRRLNEIIEYLDRPIRQVEIESQFIDISVSDAKAFGIQFFNRGFLQEDDDDAVPNTFGTLPDITGTNTLVFTRGALQARLQALASSGRARIINSPRVTTMNNLTASLVSQQQTPVVLTSTDTGIGGQVGEQENAFFLTTMIGIQVTPTIQNDDTITVFLTPQVSVQIPNPTLGGQVGGGDDDDDNNAASSIPSVSSQFVTTVANVKDNDVIVLGGLRTRTQNIVKSRIPILSKLPLIGRLFRSQNVTDVDRELVIFLTARILRRSDDVTPIQGP